MPIYEFECLDGHRFEVMRPISEFSREAECAVCGLAAQLAVGGAPVIRFRDAKYGHMKRQWTHPTRPVSEDPTF